MCPLLTASRSLVLLTWHNAQGTGDGGRPRFKICVQICQKSGRIGCVIPHCNHATYPWTFLTYLYIVILPSPFPALPSQFSLQSP